MACETLTKQFPDLKNPHLESKIIKIGQEIPKLCTFVAVENILKKVDFVGSLGKRRKLVEEAQFNFWTFSGTQNFCLEVGNNVE